MKQRTYIAIDLKSFYASAECVERGLDPLTTNLVVADLTRTEKTICLAVSPSLKSYGISGRARLFEVVEQVRRINYDRLRSAPGRRFRGKSSDNPSLKSDPSLELDYIVAPPQMQRYVDISAAINNIYLGFVSAEDLHVYSIDEVFIDVTDYLKAYGCTPHELAMRMIRAVLKQTGITATAGIGTNLYLAKVAMDVVAKHCEPDADGVRIAELDEISYRRLLWEHEPLTDFWRVGRGTAAKLQKVGITCMGELALRSLDPGWEEYLYKTFGVAAELLIDHAWGWEPCTIRDIKAYKPSVNSLSVGQVLKEPYNFRKARLIIKEMADNLSLDLVDKKMLTDQIVLSINYDSESLCAGAPYAGEVVLDWYGRPVPKPAHGSINLPRKSSSTDEILQATLTLFDRITDPALTVRRLTIAANHVVDESQAQDCQLSLFDERPSAEAERERRRQEAILAIKKKYGKNAILKGMNFEEGATAIERNSQIGGHKA